MILHFNGLFNGDSQNLPHEELKYHKDAVKFKEFDNASKFIMTVNLISFGLLFLTVGYFVYKAGWRNISFTGCLLAIAAIVPHEFLHAICHREDVYMYFAKGAAMVSGTELMRKSRFILMCVLPSFVFGIIPFLIFVFNNNMYICGTLGALSIPLCLGDFYNAVNAIIQMPKNSYAFSDKQNTYWIVSDLKIKDNYNLLFGKGNVLDIHMTAYAILSSAFVLLCAFFNTECLPFAILGIMVGTLLLCGLLRLKLMEDTKDN